MTPNVDCYGVVAVPTIIKSRDCSVSLFTSSGKIFAKSSKPSTLPLLSLSTCKSKNSTV